MKKKKKKKRGEKKLKENTSSPLVDFHQRDLLSRTSIRPTSVLRVHVSIIHTRSSLTITLRLHNARNLFISFFFKVKIPKIRAREREGEREREGRKKGEIKGRRRGVRSTRVRDSFHGDATARERGGKDCGSARCYFQEYWSRTEVRHLGPGDNKSDEARGSSACERPENRQEFGPVRPLIFASTTR